MSIDRTKYLNNEEVGCLIAACQSRTTKTGKRAWMLVDFALSTGLRVSEIASVRIEDIDWKRELVTVTRLKRRPHKRESLELKESLIPHLREYIGDRDSGSLFIGSRGPLGRGGLRLIWLRSLKLAGLPKMSIHSARHTCGTQLYEETHDLRLVQLV